jgi:ribonucleotide reductase beta subunit family protein with ferritin-like domain
MKNEIEVGEKQNRSRKNKMSNICFLNDPAHNERFLPFPIKYQKIYDMFMKHTSTFWVENEIPIPDKDKKDWESLDESERKFLSNVLTFFAKSDELVIQNLSENFLQEITVPEVKMFYSIQGFIENVHNNTYALLLNYYLSDDEIKQAHDDLQNLPEIRNKREWVFRWMNPRLPLVQRLIAFAIIEGIFFSGSFCAIYWLQSRSQKEDFLVGICKSNEFIARDEGLHTDFACMLYREYVQEKLEQKLIEKIMREAVELEIQYIQHSLPGKLEGMNSELMAEHIKFCANELLKNLGHAPLWPSIDKCPFEFMNKISMPEKANFFESLSTAYSRVHVEDDEEYSTPIRLEDEFA